MNVKDVAVHFGSLGQCFAMDATFLVVTATQNNCIWVSIASTLLVLQHVKQIWGITVTIEFVVEDIFEQRIKIMIMRKLHTLTSHFEVKTPLMKMLNVLQLYSTVFL